MHRRLLLALAALVLAAPAPGCRSGEPGGAGQPMASPVEPVDDPPLPPVPAIESITADPVLREVLRMAEADSQVDDLARELAVEIGSRLTASSGLASAEAWALESMRGWGLEASLEPWGSYPVGFERGPSRGAVVRPQAQQRELEFGTHAWTAGTGGEPVRGQAVLYPETDAQLRAAKPYLRGAWVIVPQDREAPWVGGRPEGAVGQRIDRALTKAGIAGLVWPAGGPDSALIHTHGDPDIEWTKLPKRVVVRLRGDQHADLVTALAAGEVIQLEFSIDNHFVQGPIPVHNVVADLVGGESPHETVVIGGHLDSWDGASGAVDNATGVATAMEAARLLAAACEREGVRPRRTIRVMLWSGEEQGVRGSRAWVEAHRDQLADISAVFVHDGGTNFISGLPVTPEMLDGMREAFDPIAGIERRRQALGQRSGDALEAMPFELRVVESLIVEPSDSAPFIAADVPGFFWDQAGRSDYDNHHHTQHDHYDAIIDEYQRRSALVVAIAAWNLANADAPVDRANAAPIEPRRIGALFEGTEVLEVLDGSVGQAADLRGGDRVLAVDGDAVDDLGALVDAIREGEPRKSLAVERGEERVTLELDWSGEDSERERARRRAERIERFGPDIFDGPNGEHADGG